MINGVNKWRKKPVVIEAIQFNYDYVCIERIKAFAKGCIGNISKDRHPGAKAEMEIGTLEDGKVLTVKHIATEGDYIIKGVQGEFYACKPDIFEATYEQDVDKTRFDYVTTNKGLAGEGSQLIGKWNRDGEYSPLYRDELEWHLVNKVWADDMSRHDPAFYKPVALPPGTKTISGYKEQNE